MPAYPSTYQAADAAVLQPVASLANGKVTSITFIPGGWTIVQAISDASTGVQALLLTNTLPSNTDQTVAVLALGQAWGGILKYFSGQMVNNYALGALVTSLSGQPTVPVLPTTPLFSGAYQTQYAKVESLLFAALNNAAIADQVAGLPLIVVGQAVGAPLAQLAALGFRQSRSGIPANLHTAACYTFSTPPMGDTNFAGLLTSTIPASFNVYAANVDFFAAPPTPFPGAVRAGFAQALPAKIPTVPDLNNEAVDDPWREHSGAFYTGLLTSPTSILTTPGTVTAPPAGYSADLAETLTLMTAVVYQQTQHPNSATTPPVAGFTLDSFLSASGVRWGAIFTDAPNNRIFVVFRGEICFEDSVNFLTQLGIANPSYLPGGSGIAPGADQVYAALRPALRTQATAALGKVGGTNIIVTGHAVGGVLANICALDFASSGGGFSAPTAVYTFGAPPSGDPIFVQTFNAQFATGTVTNFQLIRAGDPFPVLTQLSGGSLTPGTNVALNGTTPYDDNINHSLTSYITLLNSN